VGEQAERLIAAEHRALLSDEVFEAGAVLRSCRRTYDEALRRVRSAGQTRLPVRIAAAHLDLADAEQLLQDATALRNRLFALTGRHGAY